MKELSPPALNLKRLVKETVPGEPILVVISPGADPSQVGLTSCLLYKVRHFKPFFITGNLAPNKPLYGRAHECGSRESLDALCMINVPVLVLQELQDTAADVIGVDKYHQVCNFECFPFARTGPTRPPSL